MTFFGLWPPSAFFTASRARTAASISLFVGVAIDGHFGPFFAVYLDGQRDGPLDQQLRFDLRPILFATSVLWPSAAQHSSARCGIIG